MTKAKQAAALMGLGKFLHEHTIEAGRTVLGSVLFEELVTVAQKVVKQKVVTMAKFTKGGE